MRNLQYLTALLVLFAWASLAPAQGKTQSKPAAATAPDSLSVAIFDAQGKPDTKPAAAATQKVSDKPNVSEHEIKLGDQTIKYKATAGYLPIKDDNGKDRANFFFVAYEKQHEDGADLSKRPVTFVFNGGPGSAAVWLHLGCVGPKRVSLTDDGHAPPPPYKLVDNDQSWLDLTDLVLIDPVGTGFSRPAEGQKGESFWGVQEDVSSVGDFIRVYTTKYERWLSPKFLAGESYGTTRAAGLSQYLAARHGIALNGIILISTVLNFQTLSPSDGNEIPYALFLPTYTASAWYHKKLAPDLMENLEKTLKESEQFAGNEYLTSLTKGGSLTADQRKALVEKIARYTGLSAGFVDKANLRIGPGEFRKRLLEDQRQLIGRYDSRITGFDPQPTSANSEYDPSSPEYLTAYSATFNDYVRRVLKFENDMPYEVLSSRIGPWNFGEGGRGYLNVSSELRSAMIRTPHLRVLFVSGYFDLATPYFATDYTVNHLDLSPELRANIMQTYYMGGHMVYHPHKSHEKLKVDVRAFMEGSLPK
jgi:carboxypeptidase C (cathepsin A)